jgi:hypothetical protein
MKRKGGTHMALGLGNSRQENEHDAGLESSVLSSGTWRLRGVALGGVSPPYSAEYRPSYESLEASNIPTKLHIQVCSTIIPSSKKIQAKSFPSSGSAGKGDAVDSNEAGFHF